MVKILLVYLKQQQNTCGIVFVHLVRAEAMKSFCRTNWDYKVFFVHYEGLIRLSAMPKSKMYLFVLTSKRPIGSLRSFPMGKQSTGAYDGGSSKVLKPVYSVLDGIHCIREWSSSAIRWTGNLSMLLDAHSYRK